MSLNFDVMQIKIQHFTLFLFLLMSLITTLLWSVSLYTVNNSLNLEKTRLYRENWQIQLDQLQLSQRLWLQQRFMEVAEWMANNTDPQQRLLFINQYYLTYPEIQLIHIDKITAIVSNGVGEIPDCQNLPNRNPVSVLQRDTPLAKACLSMLKPMIGISAEINADKSQKLVLLMDYFSFIDDFEELTGKHFHIDNKASSRYNYVDSSETAESQQIMFQFNREAIHLGSLSVALPVTGFFSVWVEQAIWVLLAVLLLNLVAYLILYRALIQPLILIAKRLKKAVLTRRPGNAYDLQFLTPGLKLLHKYFMHLTYLTKRDHLTGLHNRAIFEERLQQAILEGKRSGRKYALVLVDINHFYKVNKQYGNYLGDGLLKKLASRLKSAIRESDSLARLEKDNFALLLEFVDKDQLTSTIEKLYQSLSRPYSVYGRQLTIGISIGVAIYPDHAQEMVELELKANEALLKAHQDDWPVVFVQQATDEADYSGLSLIQSLRQALGNNDFKLVYQPVMDLKNHTTSYFEALLRWKQPELHTQSIEQTIALAEKNQLIKPLSHWIIETACIQLKKLDDSPLKVAVNLSMIDFHDEDLPDRIGETLNKYDVPPQKLMVEITEGQFMQEPEQVIQILTRLSNMGISLSIDDFGTGQASLTYLKKLPVEKLKIDQSFIKDMVIDEEDRAIVEATIKLAHTLGIEVVAEGVESAEIHTMLMQMDCDYVQGYYISRPIDELLIPNWILDQNRTALTGKLRTKIHRAK